MAFSRGAALGACKKTKYMAGIFTTANANVLLLLSPDFSFKMKLECLLKCGAACDLGDERGD